MFTLDIIDDMVDINDGRSFNGNKQRRTQELADDELNVCDGDDDDDDGDENANDGGIDVDDMSGNGNAEINDKGRRDKSTLK